MKTFKGNTLYLLIFILSACGQQLVEFPQLDGSRTDTAKTDATAPDGMKPDTGNTDVLSPDFAIPDDARADSAGLDTGNTDVGNRDSLNTDIFVSDAQIIDGGKLDASITDVRIVDVPIIDVSINDVPILDVPIIDVPIIEVPIIDVSIIEVPIIDVAIIDTANKDTTGTEAANTVAETSACRQAPVVLGSVANFVVLAGSTVTSTGPTSVTGDLGVSPGTAVTGFPPGTVVGAQHAGDPIAAQGVADLTIAYNDAAGRTLCAVTVAGNLGGQTLTPGLYKSTSSLAISSGDLTLDAQGDSTAIFIFQMASTLTTTSGRQVILSGGAKSTNVFWQVGTSATLGSTTAFQGTVMADQAITLNTGATLNGRALARIAGVTLDSNTIVKPSP
jgi:hypothetical protein